MEQNHLKKIPSVNSVLEKLKLKFPLIPHLYLKRMTMLEIEKVHQNPKNYNLEAFEKTEFETTF